MLFTHAQFSNVNHSHMYGTTSVTSCGATVLLLLHLCQNEINIGLGLSRSLGGVYSSIVFGVSSDREIERRGGGCWYFFGDT